MIPDTARDPLRRPAVALALVLGATLLARSACACGASGAGTTGVASCSIAEHEEQIRKRWRVGAGASWTWTTILFGDGLDLDQRRSVALAAASYRPTRTWTLDVGLGALLGGAIEAPDGTHTFDPGPVATLGASWRALDADGARPFVLVTSQLSYADAPTEQGGIRDAARYRAIDLRVGVAVGWPILRSLSPYLIGRGFGGPVYWTVLDESRVGTDANKFQIGGGLSAVIARTIDVFVEGVPLGERGVTAGAGVAF